MTTEELKEGMEVTIRNHTMCVDRFTVDAVRENVADLSSPVGYKVEDVPLSLIEILE